MKRKRTIYAIEMWDDQFGWVRCMEGMDIPACATKRRTAWALMKQIRDRTIGGRFRLVRYVESGS
jgi:hypothetical protein